jgi:protein TonB
MAEMTAFIEPTVSNHAEIEPINIVDPTTPVGPVDHDGDDEWNNITITTPQKPGGGIIEIITTTKTPVDVVDEPALFPGGIPALRKYIADNLDLDNVLGTAKIHLKFVVDENGAISSVKISGMKGECEGCKEAAVDVVKSMPKWTPGKVNGEVVSSYYSLPIQITSE